MPSRPVLIGRGLVTHTPTKQPVQPAPQADRVHHPESEPTNPPPRPKTGADTGSPVHNRTTVHHVTAAIAARKHPDPSRTRKLSLPAPMVLHPTGCGRVGRRRTIFARRGHPSGDPFSAFPAFRLFAGHSRLCHRPRSRTAFRPQVRFRHPSSTGVGDVAPGCPTSP